MVPQSQKRREIHPTWEEGAHSVQPMKKDKGLIHVPSERVLMADMQEGCLGKVRVQVGRAWERRKELKDRQVT